MRAARSMAEQRRAKQPPAAAFCVEVSFDLTVLIGLEPGCPPAFGTLNFRDATGDSGEDTRSRLGHRGLVY